jgi:hypothetical protein
MLEELLPAVPGLCLITSVHPEVAGWALCAPIALPVRFENRRRMPEYSNALIEEAIAHGHVAGSYARIIEHFRKPSAYAEYRIMPSVVVKVLVSGG